MAVFLYPVPDFWYWGTDVVDFSGKNGDPELWVYVEKNQ
jgi:hypothetical protein